MNVSSLAEVDLSSDGIPLFVTATYRPVEGAVTRRAGASWTGTGTYRYVPLHHIGIGWTTGCHVAFALGPRRVAIPQVLKLVGRPGGHTSSSQVGRTSTVGR